MTTATNTTYETRVAQIMREKGIDRKRAEFIAAPEFGRVRSCVAGSAPAATDSLETDDPRVQAAIDAYRAQAR